MDTDKLGQVIYEKALACGFDDCGIIPIDDMDGFQQRLQEREEKDWFIYDPVLTKYFERKGPYLRPKMPEQVYDKFILHCLDLGIAFNPNYNECSIIPFGADRGTFTGLKNTPFAF